MKNKFMWAVILIVLVVGAAYLLVDANKKAQTQQDQSELNTQQQNYTEQYAQDSDEVAVEVPSLEDVEEFDAENMSEDVKSVEDSLPEGVSEDMEEKKMTNPTVMMKTTMGDIEIELFMDTMPLTAGNFKTLVEKGFYNGVIFHRVIPKFMIQGGDPTGTGMGGPGYNIKDEFTDNNRNDRGTLSMANAGPNTGGSQFFINVADNNFLDTKHPVFGKVTKGMDIVDKIVNVPRNQMDRPDTDVMMTEVTIVE